MLRTTSILSSVGRITALTLFTAAAGLALHAQAPAAKASPTLDLQAALKAPIDPFAMYADAGSSSSSSSSSSSADEALVNAPDSSTSDSMQPPPRRRYGRPRYVDSMHNADGSNKWAFSAGGGFTLPTGGTHSYLSPSYDFQGGFGRNFNKNFGVMIDFNWANFGIQSNVLNNLLAVYQDLGVPDQTGSGSLISEVGGNTHVWSFAIDPIYNFAQGEKTGAYVTGGVGYYHKAANITTPGIGDYCTFYGCFEVEANQTIDAYTSNAFGVNGGVGYTYKPSRFGNMKLYVEARYVYTANSRRPYFDGTTGTQLTPTYFNVLPQNSAPTTFIPITFGIRF